MSDFLPKAAAALVGALFSAGFVAALGSAIHWARFENANLPADQAVAALDRQEVIVPGAISLVGVLVVGGLVVLTAYVFDQKGDATASTIAVLIVAGVGGSLVAWLLTSAEFVDFVGLLALAAALVALNLGVAERTDHFTWFAASLFVSIALFGSVAAFLDNYRDPQVQAVALLRGPTDSGLTGLYVARNDQLVYVGRPGEEAVYIFPCKEVTSLAIGRLRDREEAEAERDDLLKTLVEVRGAATAARARTSGQDGERSAAAGTAEEPPAARAVC